LRIYRLRMEYRQLGRTGIEVSAYALGTMMLGADGNTDRRECLRIVHDALDHGINVIDTADLYSEGESETIVGEALRGRRDDVVLATKGHFPIAEGPNQSGNSRRHLIRAVEASLARLQTDHIDLYQVHRPDWNTAIDETLAALTDLVRAGKIRAFGCSTYPAHELVWAHHVAERHGLMRFRTEQPPYNLLARGVERDVLPVAERLGMGVLTWSPLAFGFLTGRYRLRHVAAPGARAAIRPQWFDPANPEVVRKLEAVEQLMTVADELGTTLPRLAVAFPLTHRAVSSVILGPRTPDQLTSLVEGPEPALGAEILDRIDAIVAPGTDVYGVTASADPPWLREPLLRRRTGSRAPLLSG
jgi:aryl-alcohol dehydrogenase-like predicted oxidoreductase